MIEYNVSQPDFAVRGSFEPVWYARFKDQPKDIPSGIGRDALQATQKLVEIMVRHYVLGDKDP